MDLFPAVVHFSFQFLIKGYLRFDEERKSKLRGFQFLIKGYVMKKGFLKKWK